MDKRKPCPTCPWRREVAPGAFPGGCLNWHGMRRALTEVFAPAMQCHCTPDGAEARVCVGFAAVVGFDAPSLRIAALAGRYAPAEVDVDGVKLHTLRSLYDHHPVAGDNNG